MVKFYSHSHTYEHPFPTVVLAHSLRYPNPFSRHVLCTDTISRSFDPTTQRLTTTRLHLKRSRLPSAILKLLPKSLIGASATGDSQTYVLETSTVDVREGWMTVESRNLEFRGVLDVKEKQVYRRGTAAAPEQEAAGRLANVAAYLKDAALQNDGAVTANPEGRTDVTTTVTLHSTLGQRFKRAKAGENSAAGDEDPAPGRLGFLRSWSQASLQRSIEAIGLSRTSKSQPNAMEGMKVVLERLRQGGLVAVLEGMRRDREAGMGLNSGGLKLLRDPKGGSGATN